MNHQAVIGAACPPVRADSFGGGDTADEAKALRKKV